MHLFEQLLHLLAPVLRLGAVLKMSGCNRDAVCGRFRYVQIDIQGHSLAAPHLSHKIFADQLGCLPFSLFERSDLALLEPVVTYGERNNTGTPNGISRE